MDFYCPADDMDRFVRTVKEICENRDRLSAMGVNGRKYLEKYYDVKRSVMILERHGER